MADLLFDLSPQMKEYVDRKELLKANSDNDFFAKRQAQLQKTSTVYVGNIGYYTSERQIEFLFSSCGAIADIVMGLHRVDRTPCGFGFVVFHEQEGALAAVNTLNGALLDDRRIRVDFDVGNARESARYWARGASGGSVQDEYRQNVDLGRGGLGNNRAKEGERVVLADELLVYRWIPLPAIKQQGTGGSRGPNAAGRPPFDRKRPRH